MSKLGEQIKRIRKEKKMSVETIAKQLGVSVSTIYRYENSSIEKIPVQVFEKLCDILETAPAVFMGNEEQTPPDAALPVSFASPREAMEFILKIPTLAAYGGYDPDSMDNDTILALAEDLLQQLKLVSYKYKK